MKKLVGQLLIWAPVTIIGGLIIYSILPMLLILLFLGVFVLGTFILGYWGVSVYAWSNDLTQAEAEVPRNPVWLATGWIPAGILMSIGMTLVVNGDYIAKMLFPGWM